MPELPEIETVRRVVGPQIIGSRIVSVSVNREKIIGHPDKDGFVSKLIGRTFEYADRKGKGLILILDDCSRLIIRFGMTGQLIVVPEGFPEEKHTHVDIGLDDGRHLWYIDSRMFGKLWHIDANEADIYSGLCKLGIEPFDGCLCWKYLKEKFGNKTVTIKEALLDQSIIAGIGNIWSDEILYRARICPETACNKISDAKWKRLAPIIPEVMNFGTEKNEITPEEYLEGKGRKYYDIDYLEVYGREGESCLRCGTVLKRSVIGGRSSCWCPKCQRR